jgi:hypothetical protein
MSKSRKLFTDNLNSLYHFLFGMLGVFYYQVIIIFIMYQLIDYNDVNLYVDLQEFFVGYIFMYLCISLL